MRSAKDFCEKYDCTIVELSGLLGVSVSLAQKWSSSSETISAYHQNHLELLDKTFEILKSAEEQSIALREKLGSSQLEFYLNWRRFN